MSIKPFAVFPENRPRPLNIVGEQLTVLASREATDGYEIFLWDESFYVISGEIEFGVDDEHMTGGAGTLVHVPAGTVHWFRFGTGGGQMISISGAGSRASTLFTEIDAEIPVGPPDVRKLVEVGKRNGVKMIAEP
jgi:hypothetical protein